jgi:hypothetical protein
MKQGWKERYMLLGLELADCLPEKDQLLAAQMSLRVTEKYLSDVEASVADYHFGSVQEEINFFKVVKPLFASKVAYFRLCEQSIRGLAGEEESLRLQEFKNENSLFYDYYKTGQTHSDHKWFTRLAPTSSSHDSLVTQLLALEYYMEFLKI